MPVLEHRWAITNPPTGDPTRIRSCNVRRLEGAGPMLVGEVVVVPESQHAGAVARIAELEAEVERLRGEYVAGHRDGFRSGSTSSIANPGGQ